MKLLDYIKGFRKGKDAHRIEREAMKDPFLSEALEGYDSVNGDHADRITRMQKQIVRKSQQKTNPWKYWSVAAGILLCISLGSYWFLKDPKPDLYSYSSSEQKETPILDSTAVLSAQEEKSESSTDTKEKEPVLPQKEKAPVSEKTEKAVQLPVQKIAEEKKIVSPENKVVQQEVEKQAVEVQALVQADEVSQPVLSLVDRLKSADSLSDLKIVQGKIVDAMTGEPLPGASIVQKGTPLAAVTDVDGIFKLRTDDKSKPMVVSFLGYTSKEIRSDTTALQLIALNENKEALDEVVVIGYGQQKKSTMVGSVAALKTLTSIPVIGKKEYDEYLKNNISRPLDSICKDKKGTVVLEFSVDPDGNPVEINIKKGLCASSDQEAIRLLKEGSKWTPGGGKTELKVKFQ